MKVVPRDEMTLGSTPKEMELNRRIAKLSKINLALMQRVERSMDQQANAYSLFQTAIGLEAQVGLRTEELKAALSRIERTNVELTAARDEAERAVRLKERFYTAVGHDLLQPLHAARLSLSALGDGGDESRTRRISGQIEQALTSVEEMLRTILDISRLESGMMKPNQHHVALRELFATLTLEMQAVSRAKGLMLTQRTGDFAVLSDPLMLRRILQNLLANALRYTDNGGVKLLARRRGHGVRIEVWDSGPGIPPVERTRIFEEFQRGSASEKSGATRGGFGLGLSIVQRMASALGHPLDLCSRVGHGTRFSITVPYAGPASQVAPAPEAAVVSQSYGLSQVRIVVVDNDLAVLAAMRNLLERWGCDARYAIGLDEVDAIAATGNFAPDIVLADYHLERGDCGLDAVKRLRQASRSNLPAIVITADHTEALSETVRAAGCELLCKPVKPAELRALMHHLLS